MYSIKDFRPEKIERRHHDANHLGLAGLNSSYQKVGAVTKAFGGLQNSLARLVRVDAMTGQDERYRRLRHAGLFRDSLLADLRA